MREIVEKFLPFVKIRIFVYNVSRIHNRHATEMTKIWLK